MNNKNNEQYYDLPQDCDFMVVGNNDSLKFDCSPQLKDIHFSKFRGLVINGPKQTEWPKTISRESYIYYPTGDNNSPHRLLITGLSRLPDSTLGLDGDVEYEILLVVINQTTAQTYKSRMRRFGTKSSLPSGLVKKNPSSVRTSYFNIDLVANMGIPIHDATYTVYATLGEYKSNILTIEATVKKENNE